MLYPARRFIMLGNFFLIPKEGRLRAGWRILFFLVGLVAVTRILSFLIVGSFPAIDGTSVWWLRYGIIVVIAWTFVVWFFRRFIDRRSLQSLGLAFNINAVRDLFVGLVLSGFMVAIIFVILLISGLIEIQRIGWAAEGISPILETLLYFLGIGLAVGWSEELVFRGYLLQNLRDGTGMLWAVSVMSVFYGIVHMTNPNGTWLAGLLITIFGFLRILPWLRTGQLWFGIGMHAGWNFFQGPIAGFGVSGYSMEALFELKVSGTDWITGGEFGLEAGVAVLPALFLGLVIVYAYTVNRRQTPWIQEVARMSSGHR
jgi:membrane protease YdiL (CAAX protease family)